MKTPAPAAYLALDQAFGYPAPGRPALLLDCIGALPEGQVRERFAAFVEAVSRMQLGSWEELYTRTFDLNPLVAPYIGYHIFGESYQRGPFLGRMNRTLAEAGVDRAGELPDHLGPVLRYLAATPAPLPELADILAPALDRMVSTLRDAEPGNPYVGLLLAVQLLWAGTQEKETA